MANFEQLKQAKDAYLAKLTLKEDPENENTLLLMDYTLSRKDVSDSFNILTNHVLKEMYDKHNMYFSEEDFVKKGKSISFVEKYMAAGKSVGSFGPFLLIIYMSLGDHALLGKKLAVTGLLTLIYILFELKKPCESSTQEN